MPLPLLVPLIMWGIGAATSAYGQIRAGQAARKAGEAQQEAAESQAALADYNAAVAELQAKDAIARGAEDEQRFRSSVRVLIGSQVASQAASNIDVGFGSAVDVQADAAELGELDALTIRTNAAREAWGYKVQAEDLRRRGEIARKEGVFFEATGRQQQTTARVQAIGGLIGSGSSLLIDRYGFRESSPRSTRVPTIRSRTYAARDLATPTLGGFG